MQTELKMKKWIRIPLQQIRITQCHLQPEAKGNFTDLNPLKLDSNPALGSQAFMSKGFESLKYKFESLRPKIENGRFPMASF